MNTRVGDSEKSPLKFCVWLAVMAALLLAMGCTRSSGDSNAGKVDDQIAKKTQALTPGPSFTLELPPRVTAGGAGIAAKGTLNLADRVQVKLPSGAFAGVVNLTSATSAGVEVKTGDIWSKGSVSIGDRTRVQGFLRTSGTLTRGANTVVTGVIQQGQALPAPTLSTVTVQFMNGASPLTVPNGGSGTANPGDYSTVSVGAGGTLNVRAGDYRFDSLTMSPGSILRVNATAGAVRVFVRNTLSWTGSVTSAGGDSSKLLLGYVGTANTALGGPFIGTLLSPNATLTLQTVSTGYAGGFFAKNITVNADVTVTAQPYQPLCEGVPVDDQNACTADACDSVTGNVTHTSVVNGTVCSDGNGCTQTDTCQAGVCAGSNPVTCAAPDQCHTAGTCSPSTGACSNPVKANGTPCNDGSACTQTDTCQAGTCAGSNPVVCVAQDQCHTAGTCNVATGVCSNPSKPNGSTCSDGNACTQTDTCSDGTCTGGNPITCVAQDQCHAAGVCNTSTGVCSNPVKANGTVCSDGNACTQIDTCQTGVCSGSNPVLCVAQDQCHDPGSCNPASGVCSTPAKANGSACNDNNACTQPDVCNQGVCAGGASVICVAQDQCHDAGTCNPTSGVCSNPAKSDGVACSDSDACTSGDSCGGGICVAGAQVLADDQNPCTIDTCDPSAGVVHTPAGVGSSCSDGNACNGAETCSAGGGCQSGIPLNVDDGNVCTADACNPVSGSVTHTALPGTSCGPSATCQVDGTCQENGTPPEAPALDDTIRSDINEVVKFLYTGPGAVQQGLDTTFLESKRTALIRGRVIGRDSAPLVGVVVRVAGESRYGQTVTQSDGTYSLVVNGGAPVRVALSLPGYLPVERRIRPDYKSYRVLEDVTLIATDSIGTSVTLPVSTPQLATSAASQK